MILLLLVLGTYYYYSRLRLQRVGLEARRKLQSILVEDGKRYYLESQNGKERRPTIVVRPELLSSH